MCRGFDSQRESSCVTFLLSQDEYATHQPTICECLFNMRLETSLRPKLNIFVHIRGLWVVTCDRSIQSTQKLHNNKPAIIMMDQKWAPIKMSASERYVAYCPDQVTNSMQQCNSSEAQYRKIILTPLGFEASCHSSGGYRKPLSYATVPQDWNSNSMWILATVQERI